MLLEMAEEGMEKALRYTASELKKIRAGKANPSMLDGVTIDYYGIPTPISQASSITTPDGRTIAIKPFEKGIINAIERAIINANLGLTPANDGDMIRINIPPMSEERRVEMAKKAKIEADMGKVGIRKVRQETNDDLKKLKNDGVSEDAIKLGEDRVQKLTDKFIVKADELLAAKEIDIMSV